MYICMLPNENMAIFHIRRPLLSHPAIALHICTSIGHIQYPLHVGSNPYIWFRTLYILCINYSLAGTYKVSVHRIQSGCRLDEGNNFILIYSILCMFF